MALTEKGRNAVEKIIDNYPHGAFSAKDLSDACGEKIVAATLNSVANNGYINKLGGSPVQYEAIDNLVEIFEKIKAEDVSKGCDNSNLCLAKKVKNDEFYTRYEDIEAEVMKYRKQFRDKIVYLPCDDPAEKKSEFWSFFVNNFDSFGLKKLIATHYNEEGKAYKIWIDSDTTNDGFIDDADAMQEDLKGNGDFRSPECLDIMKECDIVCTNPPFSLFREFVDAIMTADKSFLIIGNQNAFTYKEIFKLIRDNKIWTGYNMVKKFNQPDGSIKTFGNVCWFTNLDTIKRNEELVLTKNYDINIYPNYENYKAIEVDKIANIPNDYFEVMGVPITFLDKYNPNQFEILGHTSSSDISDAVEELRTDSKHRNRGLINGKEKYDRVLIRRKK
jgi:hypothetical protein